MTSFVWTAPITLPRNASVLIRESLLPMLLWPSVPVIRRVDEELTVVDRFVIESAVALAPMHAEDVAEVTTIPRDAVVRIAGRLVGLGLLRADGSDYYPIEAAVENALRERAVPEFRKASATFLYLPHTDDLIAFPAGPGRPKPPLLQKAKPAEIAPLPRELAGQDRAGLLRSRIQSERIAGLPPDIVDVADDASNGELPDSCPAYRCRGYVKSRDDGRLVLDVLDHNGRKTAQWTLTGAIEQAKEWADLTLTAMFAGEAWTALGGDVQVIEQGDGGWMYVLDTVAAHAAASTGIRLGEPAGLEIHDGERREDDRTVVAVNARFVPSDEDATVVFAMHTAIRTVVDHDTASMSACVVEEAVAAACAAYGLEKDVLSESDVVDGLWTNNHFRHVYALRAATDFDYDREQ